MVWFSFLFGTECVLPVLTGNCLFGLVWFPGWDGMRASGPNRKLFVWIGLVWFGFLFGTECLLPVLTGNCLFGLV